MYRRLLPLSSKIISVRDFFLRRRGGGRPYTGYDIKKKWLETSIRTLTRMRNIHIVTFQEGVLNMRWKTRLADIYDLVSLKRVWKTSHF